jgi:hypothetical protein
MCSSISPTEFMSCCVKLIADRISYFIEAHRVIQPESQENKWDISYPNCTLLKITQGIKKSVVISFYTNNGIMMAQGKENSINDWILLVDNMKEFREIKNNQNNPKTCMNTTDGNKTEHSLTNERNNLDQLQFYEFKESHKAQYLRLTEAYNKVIYDMTELSNQNQETTEISIQLK